MKNAPQDAKLAGVGTTAWRNWNAFDNGEPSIEWFVDEIYSDRELFGSNLELGPYQWSPTIRRSNGSGVALRLNASLHVSVVPELVIDGRLTPPDSEAYHGGVLGDELTALMSLALGVRLRDAGTATATKEADADSPAYTIELEVPRVQSPESNRGEILPRCTTRPSVIDAASERLRAFPTLAEQKEIALVRAARQYASALWWANEDANLAWLQLVGAVEAITSVIPDPDEDPRTLVQELWPELHSALDGAGFEVQDRVSRLLAPQIRATRKFVRFIEDYAPPAPSERPEWDCLDWDEIPAAMRIIYKHRSLSLHTGKPFPAPMLEAPRTDNAGVHQETPGGLSSGALGSSWNADEYPMLLTTFEYIVREALLSWWDRATEAAGEGQGSS